MNDSKTGDVRVAEPRGSSTPELEQEASRERGLRVSSRGPSAWWRRAEWRVWALPLGKWGAFLLALGCVAMLGERAEEQGRLGVEPDSKALHEDAREKLDEAKARVGEAAGSAATTAVAPKASTAKEGTPCVTTGSPASASSALLPDGRIVLNEATIEDFRKLPGIGQRRAEALLALREKLGKFKKLTDLLRVKGIGPKSLVKFKEKAVLDRPVEPPPAP